MAEGVVVKLLIGKVISSLILKEIGMIMGAVKEMKKLESTLSTIQSVLEDAELRPLKSEALQNWLRKIKEAAYEVEDILEEYATLGSILESKGGTFKHLKKILFRRKIARGIKKMNDALDALAKERREFHLNETGVPNSSKVKVNLHRETTSTLIELDHVYGRDEDRQKIVGMLVNDQAEHLFVLPILGAGGLGKTTLAQLVYNDERVSKHFDAKLWVCVSADYDLKELLKNMIVSATGSASNIVKLDASKRHFCEVLGDKRCLLVLDDVQNHKQDDLVELKSILVHATKSKGLSIVVTTRLKRVAEIMGTNSAYSLEGLSEEHLWLLFKLIAFEKPEEAEQYPNLEAIGRQILKKCAGVPLAAKALGGLLRFKRKENDWIHVRESEIWDLPEEETQILPALRLSYHHLPLKLRQCFAYCAVFPKDYKMVKQDLIFRWMAHGFISSVGRIQEVEDVGDQVWNELVLRSIFQEVSTTFEGKTTCKMHDLIHDFAQSILGNKVYGVQMENNLNESCCKVRELFSSTLMLTSIMDYTGLRVLKIQDESMEELPSAINKLKHLRYLELACPKMCSFPRTFFSLRNLQILILNDCGELLHLPENLRCMTNMRHIVMEDRFWLRDTPPGIGEMTLLKTLSVFIVGHGVGNQLDQLQHLNLGGRLVIEGLANTKNPTDARNANLVNKPNLHDLVLRWHWWKEKSTNYMMDEKVLEALEPHPNLKTLEIKGFRGSYFPSWMAKMKNVTNIRIEHCPNCSHLSPLGYLPHLKSLFLQRLEGLEYIVDQNKIQSQHSVGAKLFPSLERLLLEFLPNLKGLLKEEVQGEIKFPNNRYLSSLPQLTSPLECFLNLTSLDINACPKFAIPSVMPPNLVSLHMNNYTQLEIRDEDWHKIAHIPDLRIYYRDEQGERKWIGRKEVDSYINLASSSKTVAAEVKYVGENIKTIEQDEKELESKLRKGKGHMYG